MKSLRPIALLSVLLLSQCETPSGIGGGSKRAKLAAATKAAPFVNSLGMKFVPVPGTNILMCTTETTVGQYVHSGRGFEPPGFPQGGDHPVVNVSWKDAKAWCAWLSKREGLKYRLPTDHEWSCAVGIGHLEDANANPKDKSSKKLQVYPWGHSWPPLSGDDNLMGLEHMESADSVAHWRSYQYSTMPRLALIKTYRDNHVFTAPVGIYKRNNIGIHDLGGNVKEWCEDLYDSLSLTSGHVARGGAWDTWAFCSSDRDNGSASIGDTTGFRCVIMR